MRLSLRVGYSKQRIADSEGGVLSMFYLHITWA
jgi:hypothetical protein